MLGKIVSINNSKVFINLSINIYTYENLIGKFVTFSDKCIGEIVNISTNVAEINLIGEINDGKFVCSGIALPSFNDSCRLSNDSEINMIFNLDNSLNFIKIGKSYLYNNHDINLDINSFFTNHFAVFGNSGSGKSCFVAKLLQEIFYHSKKLPYNANIFLFDAYGEYQQAFNNISTVNANLNYRVFTTNLKDNNYEKLFIPFWFLGVDDLCLLLNVDDVRQISIIEKALKYVYYFVKNEEDVLKQKNDIIARCILDVIFSGTDHNEVRNKITTILAKFKTKDINLDVNLTKGGWTRSIRQCIYVDNTQKFADIEVVINYLEKFCADDFELTMPDGSFMYSINDFYSALEFALISEGIFNSNRVFDYANVLKIRLNTLINSDYVSFFKCDRFMNRLDYIKYLLYNGNKKYQIVNFNINYVDDRFAKVIVKIYSKMLFDFIAKIPNRASFPFHIILEEAHRYVQNDTDVNILGYNIFDRIAKEGRKYGILLGLISQRPSEISQTAVSQCSNFAIFKMFDSNDISFVSNSIAEVSDSIISKIKVLSPGSCMLFGSSFKIPFLTKVDLPNPIPKSKNCNINNTWFVN